MKKKFKVISLILASSVIASCLAACGDKDETPTLIWYMPKSMDNMSSEQMVEDEVNKIFEQEVGAKIDLVLIDEASYGEKMNVVINSGEEFDIMMAPSWYSSTSYETNAPRGSFADLTDMLEEYGQDIKAKVDPRAWEYVTYDDKVQIIPWQMRMYPEIGWVFKKDLVEKYNFDYKSVNTLRDLEPYLETLKKNEPNVVPVLDITSPNWGESFIYSLGGGALVIFDEEKEEFKYLLDDERNVEDYRIRNEWYQKGYFPKDALTLNEAEARKTGKYAVMRDAGAVTEDGSKSSAAYGFPCVETAIENHAFVEGSDFRTGMAISATSKHPVEAMKVLNLLWKDPYISNTLAYGIENVDYVYISGKGTDSPSVQPKEAGEATWGIWHNYLGPLFDQWDSSWNSKEALMKMQEDNKKAVISKKANVQFNADQITAELAALSEIWQASEKVLQYGAMTDFDGYIDELRQKCETAGIQTVIDDLNRQYKEAKDK